jgi:hypothetical protein
MDDASVFRRLEYTLERADCFQLLAESYVRQWMGVRGVLRLAATIPFSCLLVCAITFGADGPTTNPLGYLLGWIAFLAICHLIVVSTFWFRSINLTRKRESTAVEFLADQIRFIHPDNELGYPWTSIESARASGRLVYLVRGYKEPLIAIPKRAIGRESEIKEFLAFVSSAARESPGLLLQTASQSEPGAWSVTFRLNHADMERFVRMTRRKKSVRVAEIKRYFISLAFRESIIVVFWLLFRNAVDAFTAGMFFLAGGAVVAIWNLFYFTPYFQARGPRFLKLLESPIVLSMSKTALVSTSASATLQFEWNRVDEILSDQHAVYFGVMNGSYLIVPNSAFTSPEARGAFAAIAESYRRGEDPPDSALANLPAPEGVWPPPPRH